MHNHLRRLERIWIENPIYFITGCTFRRQPILARKAVTEILVDEWRRARARHGGPIGAYGVVPDHVHFFAAAEHDTKSLGDFMREWKSWTSRRIRALLPRPTTAATTLWKREFFDHILRSGESYTQKSEYVRNNPARAGLVRSAEDWPYADTIEELERVG